VAVLLDLDSLESLVVLLCLDLQVVVSVFDRNRGRLSSLVLLDYHLRDHSRKVVATVGHLVVYHDHADLDGNHHVHRSLYLCLETSPVSLSEREDHRSDLRDVLEEVICHASCSQEYTFAP